MDPKGMADTMRILFCNIAWMDYYKGIVQGKDEPQNGGSYVRETLDAHEKYNFEAVSLTRESGYPEGEYCLGFVETKSTNNESKNQLRIEKISGFSIILNSNDGDNLRMMEIFY